MPGFLAGFAYPFRGLAHLLRTPRLWKYAALPLAVNVVVYTALALGLWLFVQDVLLGDWMARTWTWLRWLVGIAAYAAGAVLLAFSFTIVGNVVASPFLDFLAERMLADLRGRALPPAGAWWRAALLSIGRQIVKLAVFGSIQIALLALLFVPVVNFVHPPLAWLVTVFFLALEYLEYPQSADRMPVGERLGYVVRHGRASFGFGAALFVIVLVPFVGYFALPACVTAATLLYHDIERVGNSALKEPSDRL